MPIDANAGKSPTPSMLVDVPRLIASYYALKPDVADHDYRFARKNVIEAIAAVSDSAGRMSIEPIAARKGLEEMAALLIAAHGLVARLSAARLGARTGAPAPDEATRMLGANAAAVYRFDVAKLQPVAARIGPSVTEVHGASAT